jgi:hypothetical protein
MPLWEWILVTASLAIPVTAVMVATTFMRDLRDVQAAVPCPESEPAYVG